MQVPISPKLEAAIQERLEQVNPLSLSDLLSMRPTTKWERGYEAALRWVLHGADISVKEQGERNFDERGNPIASGD